MSSARAPWPVSTLLWLAGSVSLLVPPLLRWIASPVDLRVPATPVDHVNRLYARQWNLLQEARGVVPPGQTYTAIAKDKSEEMILYMLSLGVFHDRLPMPSSYWNRPMAEGAGARYVVSYECLDPPGAPRLVRRFSGGCIWERFTPPK